MSKPLIDGKKLSRSPSFAGVKMSAKENDFTMVTKEDPLKQGRAFTFGNKPGDTKKTSEDFQSTSPDDEASSSKDDITNLDTDPIFQKLCPKEQYKNESQCKICEKQFSTLKFITKKICKFCGSCVCEEHGKKKRGNPENPSEYVRICDKCDEKYIKRIIIQEFSTRMKKKEKEVNEWESKIKEQQVKINDAQKEYDALWIEKAKSDKNYSEQVNFLTTEITQMKDEIKRCEKDNTHLTKDFNDTQKKVEELDGKIHEAQEEYNRLMKEAETLNQQIEAANQDIEQVKKHLSRAEAMLNNGGKIDNARNLYNNGRYGKSVTNNDISRLGSLESSMMSDLGGKPRSHYESQRISVVQKKRSKKAGEEDMSNQCNKCNLF